jgi:uncharacterized membrane protein YhaH (DUF805 family)
MQPQTRPEENFLKNEFMTRGRLGRKGFWLRHASTVPLGMWCAIRAGEAAPGGLDVALATTLVVHLVSIYGRRLHDRGRSAAWLFAFTVPVLGGAWLAVECMFRRTSPRADRFGPAPGTRTDYLVVTTSAKPTTQP